MDEGDEGMLSSAGSAGWEGSGGKERRGGREEGGGDPLPEELSSSQSTIQEASKR